MISEALTEELVEQEARVEPEVLEAMVHRGLPLAQLRWEEEEMEETVEKEETAVTEAAEQAVLLMGYTDQIQRSHYPVQTF